MMVSFILVAKVNKWAKKTKLQKNPSKAIYTLKNGIIGFFYIHNIVLAYKKDHKDEIDQVVDVF